MLFYWLIEFFRTIVALFHLPKPEDLAMRNENLRCPVCGWRKGRLRCVQQVRGGQIVNNSAVPPEQRTMLQHRCGRCGARWHEKPLAEGVTPELVLPCVPRDEIEEREDRHGRMYQMDKIA